MILLCVNFLVKPLSICLQVMQTRKVDTEDYMFFSIGTVELKDRTVLHVIGILGNWWIYHVSYAKRVEPL